MKKMILTLVGILALGSSVALAGPYTATMTADGFDASPDAVSTPNQTAPGGAPNIYEAINLLLGTSYASNGDIDGLQYTSQDNTWVDFGDVSSSAGYALVGLSAGNSNTLNVYDVTTPGTKVDVFGGSFSGFGFTGDGTALNPFPSAGSPLVPGTEFGWSLASFNGSTTTAWDSNPGLNSDSLDHMLTYRLSDLVGKKVFLQDSTSGEVFEYTFEDPWVIAWEDLSLASNGAGSDQDYNDMIYVIDRVKPAVVPEPMSLALLGSGLAGMLGFRRKNKVA